MHKLRVYEEATLEQAQRHGCKPIPVRWVDVNKWDRDNVLIRSRAVAQETRGRTSLGKEDAFATCSNAPAGGADLPHDVSSSWLSSCVETCVGLL